MPEPVGPCRWDLPDPTAAPPDEDMVGYGGDLAPSTLVAAYSRGIFPMPIEPGGEIGWWSPNPRGHLPLDGMRITRSLAKSVRRYRATIDTAFDDVVAHCADPSRPLAWIDDQIAVAYSRLHRMGWAHSVEVWNADGRLIGGLYGIEVGGLFAGESMFHLVPDASKVALVALVEALRAGGRADERVLDVQWRSEHLGSLGVTEVPRDEYVRMAARAVLLPPALSS